MIKHVTASHEGNYSCIANNSVGSVESRNASLTIGDSDNLPRHICAVRCRMWMHTGVLPIFIVSLTIDLVTGNVLTCCFSTTIGISSYTVAESPRLYLNISSNYYNVSSITMTKISGNRQLQLESMERHHYSRFWAYFRGDKATYSDTGVYRCHLVLSNSTSNSTDMDTNVTVSFYTPIFVRGAIPNFLSFSIPMIVLCTLQDHLVSLSRLPVSSSWTSTND